jgi:hypothetical protein
MVFKGVNRVQKSALTPSPLPEFRVLTLEAIGKLDLIQTGSSSHQRSTYKKLYAALSELKVSHSTLEEHEKKNLSWDDLCLATHKFTSMIQAVKDEKDPLISV